jgi:NADH:ubiquinone oxidoreductase subunit D/NADH:ubiquinone oxidoreductase subunit C
LKVVEITDSIILKQKNEIEQLFKSYEKVRGLICKGVSCIELSELDTFTQKYDISGHSFFIVYHFHNLDSEKRFHIGVPLLYGQTLQSYSYIWPSLFYFENEIEELYGIKIYRHERIQKEILEKSTPSYMEKSCSPKEMVPWRHENEFEEGIDVVKTSLAEYGIQSQRAALNMAVHGKKIIGLKTSTEGVFLGLEKLFEQVKINHVDKYISHINGAAFIPYQILWCETLEKSQGFEPNSYERSKRMLVYEFSKVIENIRSLSLTFKVLDEVDPHLKCREFLNKLKVLLLEFGPSRPYPIFVKPCHDQTLPEGWKRSCSSLIKSFVNDFEKLKSNVTRLYRVVDLSHISPASMNALKCGYTGLPLRSFGVSYDLRKNDRFYLYDELDLNIPLGISGTSYDRILIRLEEVKESFSNIIRLIESFPVPNNMKEEQDFIPMEEDKLFFSYCENSSGEVNYLSVFKQGDDKLNRLHVMTPTKRTLKIYEESYNISDLDLMITDWVSLGMNMEEVTK